MTKKCFALFLFLILVLAMIMLSGCSGPIHDMIAGGLFGETTRFNPESGSYEKIRVPPDFLIIWYEIVPWRDNDYPFRRCASCHDVGDLINVAYYRKRFGNKSQSSDTSETAQIIINKAKEARHPRGHRMPFL